MRKRAIIALFTICLALAVVLYLRYRFSTATPIGSTEPATPQGSAILRAPSVQQEVKPFESPPPPPPVGSTYQPSPEPSRALVGVNKEALRQIEKYLPAGASVSTYPVSGSVERAAYAKADLMGDGLTETIVVYHAPGPPPDGGGQPLFLGVLVPEGNGLTLRSSTTLYGGLIYVSINDKNAVPFAISDVTGDGHPEIVVTSGVGASLGGAIQVYSFDGSSLHQLVSADGHTLRLYEKGAGRPAEISAQSRYEDKARRYRWNGKAFASQQ